MYGDTEKALSFKVDCHAWRESGLEIESSVLLFCIQSQSSSFLVDLIQTPITLQKGHLSEHSVVEGGAIIPQKAKGESDDHYTSHRCRCSQSGPISAAGRCVI